MEAYNAAGLAPFSVRRAGSAEAIDLDLAQVAWRAPPPPPPKYEWDAAADAALAEAFGLAAEADKLAKEWHKMGMPPELGCAVAPPAGGADDQGQKDLAGVVQKLFPKTWMTKVRVQKRWDLLRAQQKKEEDEQKKAEREQRAERAAAADAAAAPQGDALVGQTVEVKWDGKKEWYEAEVLGYDASSGQHSVRYVVDGVEQPEALSPTGFRRRWRLGKGSAAAAAAAAAAPSREPSGEEAVAGF